MKKKILEPLTSVDIINVIFIFCRDDILHSLSQKRFKSIILKF